MLNHYPLYGVFFFTALTCYFGFCSSLTLSLSLLFYYSLYPSRIDEYGMPYLVYFLKQCNSLITLDVSNNNLSDFLCSDVIHCIARPPEAFDDHETADADDDNDDDDLMGGFGFSSADRFLSQMRAHNYSITELNIGYNQLGEQAMAALTNMVKQNAVLRVLHIEMSTSIPPKSLKVFSHAMRLYNSVLQQLSLADTPLSVKSAGLVARMLDSNDCKVSALTISNCSLKHQHMHAMVEHLLASEHLTSLNISGNKIGIKGAEALAAIINGKRNYTLGVVNPPLKALDCSSCAFEQDACAKVAAALATRRSLFKCIEMSGNAVGPDNTPFFDNLGRLFVKELQLNSCALQSKGGAAILMKLSDPSSELASSLKFCYIANNEISDSASPALCAFLENNTVLEILDLGFNLISGLHAEKLQRAQQVQSKSTQSKKVFQLSINLIGNNCDPYLLQPPGLSRAAENFKFGVQRNFADSANQGYSHVASAARGHFLARKEVDDQYRTFFPTKPTNHLS